MSGACRGPTICLPWDSCLAQLLLYTAGQSSQEILHGREFSLSHLQVRSDARSQSNKTSVREDNRPERIHRRRIAGLAQALISRCFRNSFSVTRSYSGSSVMSVSEIISSMHKSLCDKSPSHGGTDACKQKKEKDGKSETAQ